ncbi:MAG: TnpA family transposase [Candidatus Promineifilaceae bacterium]
MTSIERTAYPRFESEFSEKILVELYTPSEDEIEFAKGLARQPDQQLALLIALKCVQRLGYFPILENVPMPIQQYLCNCLAMPHSTLPIIEKERTRYRHRDAIRALLGLKTYTKHGGPVVDTFVLRSAETMSDPADLVNVALEQLHRSKVELPGFTILRRRVNHIRHQVHETMYEQVLDQLSPENQAVLDGLLVVPEGVQKSQFNRLKETPGPVTLKNFRAWEQRAVWLKSLLDAKLFLGHIAHTKIKQFAAQARALELSDIRDIADSGKQYTFLLCFLQDVQVSTLDQLTSMFLRRMKRITKNAKDRLVKLREEYLSINESIVSAFGEITEFALDTNDDLTLGQQVRNLLDERGGAEELSKHTNMLSAYHNNNYLPLMWEAYKSHRRLLFKILNHLEIKSATQDSRVLTAISFLEPYQRSRRKFLPPDISIDFAGQRWQPLIKTKNDNGELVFDRRHLEVCTFHYLALGISRGDLYVEDSEEFADYRQQLLSWEECEPKVSEYCRSLGLPDTPKEFVKKLRNELTLLADKIDEAFPDNADLTIDADGHPHLTRTPRRIIPDNLDDFRLELKDRLPERHLLDILRSVHHWVNYTKYFGPPSGSERKMADSLSKYFLTIFGYGSGMGAAQTARHTRGLITRRAMKRISDQHITSDNLDESTRDIVNEYVKFRLPFMWGTGKHAVADGTHIKLIDNNLLGQHHFRYGEYGAIAYHHVSDTYIALFSHFISCGVWEAVFILDGLLKNESIIQPDTIHADTQGQTQTVFGLSYLMGIQLMPRMRNWNKVDLCRPDRKTIYKHIDRLFNDIANWDLVEMHWRDYMQVVLSIQAGKVLPSMLLQKLGSHNKQNKLYKAFTEIGRIIRTIFLLKYLSSMELRQEIRAMTIVVERYNDFLDWVDFGGDGVLRSRDPVEQEKRIKYLNLIANAVMLQNVVDMTDALSEMSKDGYIVSRELVSHLSPYLTEHIKRFGEYVLDMDEPAMAIQPNKPFLSEEIS